MTPETILNLCLGRPEVRNGRALLTQSKGQLRGLVRWQAHFTECEISFGTLNELGRIWIAASRVEDSTRQWLSGRTYRRPILAFTRRLLAHKAGRQAL